MDSSTGVQSVHRAFALLEILSANPAGIGLLALSRESGLHKSTVHRLLASLIDLGYVTKMPEGDGKYCLTMKMFTLSAPLVDNVDLLSVARPHLEALRDKTGETVHLVVRDGNEIVYIFKAESTSNAYRMFSRLGMRREMYCTAAGKSILAHLPESHLEAMYGYGAMKPYTPHTITSLPRLAQNLALIKQCGYALDNEENEVGVRCIAAAVTNYSGDVPGAFSLSAPIARMTDDIIASYAGLVANTEKQISAELGSRK